MRRQERARACRALVRAPALSHARADSRCSVDELRALAAAGKRRCGLADGTDDAQDTTACTRIVLLVPDASWKKARKLTNSLPEGTWRCRLEPEHILALGDASRIEGLEDRCACAHAHAPSACTAAPTLACSLALTKASWITDLQ